MIAIINVTPNGEDADGMAEYRVQINQQLITTFRHKRSDGLSKCLCRASIAVNEKKLNDLVEAYMAVHL